MSIDILSYLFGKRSGTGKALDTAFPIISNEDTVTIDDGGAGMPVRSMKIAINSVQDLHGYENPWPEGGGVNQWDEVWEVGGFNSATGAPDTQTDRIRSKNHIPVVPGQRYFFRNPTSPYTSAGMQIVFYDENKTVTRTNGGYGYDQALLIAENERYVRFCIGAGYGNTYVGGIGVNFPATETKYYPYSNICPISGWTEANIYQRKNNFFEGTYEAASIVTTANRYDTSVLGRTAIVRIKGGKKYYIKKFDSSNRFKILWSASEPVNGDHPTLLFDSNTTVAKVIDTPEEANYLINFVSTSGEQAEPRMLVALADSTTDYEEYEGKTYTVSWQSEAGTIYVGTLTDNGNGTWTLLVTHKGAVFDGTEEWEEGGVGEGLHNYHRLRISDAIIDDAAIFSHTVDRPNISRRNTVLGARVYTSSGYPTVLLRLFLDQSAEDFSAYLQAQYAAGTPVTAMYELATPQSYTISAESVKTMLGDNVIFADCGPIEEISYRTDPDIVREKLGEG